MFGFLENIKIDDVHSQHKAWEAGKKCSKPLFEDDILVDPTEVINDAKSKLFNGTIDDTKSDVKILEEKQNDSEIESEVAEEDNK